MAVAVARMDADLYPDVIVSNYGSNEVSVLLNDGSGSFGPAVDYAVGSNPWGIIAEDLNGDGANDVAVVNSGSGTFWVLLNNGDGTLSFSGSHSATGFSISPSWIAGGDFDGDEDVDLAVVKVYQNYVFSEGYVQIFENDGNGSFTSRETFTLGWRAATPLIGDFDGDGDNDLAVSGTAGLSMFLNTGAGVFAPAVTHLAGASGRAVCDDFDFDQDLDVAISDENSSGSTVAVILNHGDATFAYPFTISVGDDPRGLACGDFDSDGDGDIAVAIKYDNNVAVALSSANPTGVDDHGPWGPVSSLALHQNYPNPFGSPSGPRTAVAFDLLRPAQASMRIYNVSGRLVRTLLEEEYRPSGRHTTFWDGRDDYGQEAAAGVYMCRVEADGKALTRQMTLLR